MSEQQIQPEANVNGKSYVYIDTESGRIGLPSKLVLVDIAEGDMEYLATCTPEQVADYGQLEGSPVMSIYEAAEWLDGINGDLRHDFLRFYDPQPDDKD